MASNRLSSVSAAARLLKAFTATNPTWGVTELANHLEMSKSSVHRILATLADEDILEQVPETGRYRLGLTMFDLAAAVPSQRSLHEAVLLPMTELRNRTGETVQVGVLDGREVVYVERLESPNTLRLFTNLGRRNDAHCTSTGKVLLAFSPKSQTGHLLKDWSPKAKTSYTITSMDLLRDQLKQIRRDGTAENHHESEIGVISLAAPIRDGSGTTIAAMSVAGPADRMEANRTQITEAIIVLSRATSKQLGYRGR